MYARRSDRASRTAADRRSLPLESSFEGRSVIGFKGSQAGFEELAVRHDNDVEPRREGVSSENFSYQSFGAISLDGSAKLLRRRDPEAANRPLIRQNEYGAEPTPNSDATLIYLLKFGPATNPLISPKACAGSWRPTLGSGRASRHGFRVIRC